MKINWGAVLLAAIVDFLLGAVWFTLFKAQWTAGADQDAASGASHPDFWPYVISFLCSLLLAYVIARIVASSASHTLLRGLSAGALVGLATFAAMVTEMAFEMKGRNFMAISAGYPLVGCILMGLVIGVWRPRAKTSVPIPAAKTTK